MTDLEKKEQGIVDNRSYCEFKPPNIKAIDDSTLYEYIDIKKEESGMYSFILKVWNKDEYYSHQIELVRNELKNTQSTLIDLYSNDEDEDEL